MRFVLVRSVFTLLEQLGIGAQYSSVVSRPSKMLVGAVATIGQTIRKLVRVVVLAGVAIAGP